MSPKPPPLPFRARTQSGHDVPIPEAVFHALQSTAAKADAAKAEATAARLEIQGVALQVSGVAQKLAELGAASRSELYKQIAAIAIAALGVIGTVVAVRPSPAAPEIHAVRGSYDLALDECRPLPARSDARAECFRSKYEQYEAQRH